MLSEYESVLERETRRPNAIWQHVDSLFYHASKVWPAIYFVSEVAAKGKKFAMPLGRST
jgi:hypothetical protein